LMTSHGGHIGRKPFPLPMQLGRDAAGEVVGVGEAVTTFRPGDRVVGLVHPENSNSLEAIRGLGNLSTGVDLPGHTAFGGNAQYVSRSHADWLPIAESVSYDEIAAAMWACSTAHHIVNGRLNVRPNDSVLVTGASGGMGTATMQVARLAGATVIATTRSAEKGIVSSPTGPTTSSISAPEILRTKSGARPEAKGWTAPSNSPACWRAYAYASRR